jgi:hypothetical protein
LSLTSAKKEEKKGRNLLSFVVVVCVCVCVCGWRRRREKDNCFFPSVFLQRREREGVVVFPSFVPSNERRQHRQTEELFFSPTLILVFGVLNLEEKNHIAEFRV